MASSTSKIHDPQSRSTYTRSPASSLTCWKISRSQERSSLASRMTRSHSCPRPRATVRTSIPLRSISGRIAAMRRRNEGIEGSYVTSPTIGFRPRTSASGRSVATVGGTVAGECRLFVRCPSGRAIPSICNETARPYIRLHRHPTASPARPRATSRLSPESSPDRGDAGSDRGPRPTSSHRRDRWLRLAPGAPPLSLPHPTPLPPHLSAFAMSVLSGDS